jgi:phosphoribosyl-dephospho-CoA transferase
MPGAAHGQRFAAAGVRGAAHGQRFAAVGVRGAVREQRFAAWVAVEDVLECVTPQELVRRKAWRSVVDRARVASIPALAVLDEVAGVLEAYGLGGVWGPGGSVGFELASGFVTATAASDLDLVIEIDRLESFAPGARALAKALVQLAEALGELPVRVDALLETPDGAVVLSEYAHACGNGGSFVLRTPEGPRLIRAAAAPLAAARL